jgi:hypothetical protein
MRFRSWMGGLFIVVLLTPPVHAHHSFAAEYDSTKPISIKGVVRKLAWANPHAYIYVDAKDEAGNRSPGHLRSSAPTPSRGRGGTARR